MGDERVMGERRKVMDRRDFVSLTLGATAAGVAGVASAAMSGGASSAAAGVASSAAAGAATNATPGAWHDAIIINALGDLEDPNPAPGAKDPAGPTQAVQGVQALSLNERALNDATASGLNAINITLGYVSGNMEPFEYTISEIGQWDAILRKNSDRLLKVYTASDILLARGQHKIGVIYGFQNAAMVGTNPARIDIFANLGVRVIQLTYNPANALGDGSMAPENRPLTPLGHAVVERLNANRIMVDLSHSGEKTCLDAARTSKQPISINHTGCRALNNVPRNKTDEELRLVATKGGFVGIYFMPFLNASSHATAEDVVAHIEHAVNVCGEDHVGIGTDGPVTAIDDLEAYKSHLAAEIAARRAAGISATGERPDSFPFVVDLRGVGQFRELADRLQRRGYTTGRIEKILGRNFLRYARDIWGVARAPVDS
jgi:membrane dipeptidase